MKLDEVLELYSLISKGTENVSARKLSRALRKAGLASVKTGQGFKKIAFDTRRIDQETEYNPRRGLQNYQRSEAFINEAMSQKVQNFAKLRRAVMGLKQVYGREPEWQESNARVLLSTLDNGLRINAQDEDFAENQPGMGSFDYLEELMHVRYRLSFDDMSRMNESELTRIVLSKDEELIHKNAKQSVQITKQDVVKHGYDALLDKLFDGCRASIQNPDIERTVTITIRDKFNKEG